MLFTPFWLVTGQRFLLVRIFCLLLLSYVLDLQQKRHMLWRLVFFHWHKAFWTFCQYELAGKTKPDDVLRVKTEPQLMSSLNIQNSPTVFLSSMSLLSSWLSAGKILIVWVLHDIDNSEGSIHFEKGRLLLNLLYSFKPSVSLGHQGFGVACSRKKKSPSGGLLKVPT